MQRSNASSSDDGFAQHDLDREGDDLAGRPLPTESALRRKDVFLQFCSALNWVAGLTGFLSCVCNLLILGSQTATMQAAEIALRWYGLLFGVLIVLSECELQWFFSRVAVLESWIGRGLFVAFTGVLLVAFEYPGEAVLAMDMLRHVVGYALIALGGLYFCMGLLCVRQLKQRHISRIQQRLAMRAELVELETQKQEIERLLNDTESQLDSL